MTATKRTPPRGNLTHGAIATYHAGCSCRDCRAAAARYRAELRARRRAEQEAAMDAERRPIDQWSLEAACRGQGPTDWFPYDDFADPHVSAICAACPVQPECLDYALRYDLHGIWGGAGERTRRRLRRTAGIRTIPLVPSELRPTFHDPEERTAS